MILLFFFHSANSALQPGQDPYAIMGIDRKATNATIKAAYRKLARKWHPDRNREHGANLKMMTINDAYELLMNEKARALYDTLGIVDPAYAEQPKENHVDKIRDILRRDAAARSTAPAGEFGRQSTPKIIELNDDTFMQRTTDHRPWVLYVFSGNWGSNDHQQLLEDLFQTTGLLFGIAKIRASSCPKTIEFLNINPQRTALPLYVFVDRESERVVHYTGNGKIMDITRFAIRQFGAQVTAVHSDEEIVRWRKTNLDKLHVILFSARQNIPVSFELVSAVCRNAATFAFASINAKNRHLFPRAFGSVKLEDYSTMYIVYRAGKPRDDTFGGPLLPLVAPMELDSGELSAIIRRYSYPIFPELNGGNFDRLCHEYCLIYAKRSQGDIALDIKIGLNDMNLPTGVVNLTKEKNFRKAFNFAENSESSENSENSDNKTRQKGKMAPGLEEGDILYLRPADKQYAIWKEVTTWKEMRLKLEYHRIGFAKFQKLEGELPRLTDPSGSPIQKKVKEFMQQLNSMKIKAMDSALRFHEWFKMLPSAVVLGGIAVILVVIGWLFEGCCNKSKSDGKDKYE